jgi:hypothetical protein
LCTFFNPLENYCTRGRFRKKDYGNIALKEATGRKKNK